MKKVITTTSGNQVIFSMTPSFNYSMFNFMFDGRVYMKAYIGNEESATKQLIADIEEAKMLDDIPEWLGMPNTTTDDISKFAAKLLLLAAKHGDDAVRYKVAALVSEIDFETIESPAEHYFAVLYETGLNEYDDTMPPAKYTDQALELSAAIMQLFKELGGTD